MNRKGNLFETNPLPVSFWWMSVLVNWKYIYIYGNAFGYIFCSYGINILIRPKTMTLLYRQNQQTVPSVLSLDISLWPFAVHSFIRFFFFSFRFYFDGRWGSCIEYQCDFVIRLCDSQTKPDDIVSSYSLNFSFSFHFIRHINFNTNQMATWWSSIHQIHKIHSSLFGCLFVCLFERFPN